MAVSSSRIRSDVAQSFAALASMRIRSSISTSGGLDTQPLVKQINAWLEVPYKDETTTDENGKLTAKTALKQCKYASRTWAK